MQLKLTKTTVRGLGALSVVRDSMFIHRAYRHYADVRHSPLGSAAAKLVF